MASQAALGQRPHLDVFGTDYDTPDGTCVRDYIQVNDLARAHLVALQHLRDGGGCTIMNCGYGHGASVLEVVDVVRRVSGVDFEARLSPRRPGDPDVRLSTFPTLHGERAVVRLFAGSGPGGFGTLEDLGLPVEITDALRLLLDETSGAVVLAGPAGLAATRKLLRSVFYKGMSASIVEALDAADAADLREWLTGHIAEELASLDAATLTRIVTGTRQHAVRRGHEMAAAAEMLTDFGVTPIMATASQRLHERLVTE